MLVVDFSQITIANLMQQLGNHTNVEVEVGILRHMVLNSLRLINTKFRGEYGEMIIACDDRGSWRKNIFPYYKANRKRDRDASELDWNQIFDAINTIRDELRENFPYRVIQVDGAEADDIIGTLVLEYGNSDTKILIVSGDKDFQQLHRFKNVKQYDPTRKKYITCQDPDKFLKEHIIRGDVGDGVPNIMSPDNSLAVGIRQRQVRNEKLERWLDLDPTDFCDSTMLIRYNRNRAMIDLSQIPNSVKQDIMTKFNEQHSKPRAKIMPYFIQNKMRVLLQSIQDF